MLTKLLKTLVLASAITLASCSTTEYVYVSEPLPIPDRATLPTIPADYLTCLEDYVYEALVKRDAIQAAHIDRLESIIRTTHED